MNPQGRDESPTLLELPEGPRGLFAVVEPVLSRYFTPEGYRIGGGTVLAGLWRHRHSTDVDLFADPAHFETVVSADGPRMEAELVASVPGIAPERSWVEPENIHLSVDGGEVTMLPVARIHPEDPGAPRVGKSDVRAESPAEILSKKIRLRMLGEGAYLIRDLYDLAVAGLRDPEALEKALSRESPRRLRQVARELGTLPHLGGMLLRPEFPWTTEEIRDRVVSLCETATP